MKKILIGLALAVAVATMVGLLWLRTLNHYATPETLSLAILEGPVTVHRDAMGVPYIFAETEADLIRAQGFVVAQDRLFQLEFYRALIQGRLAEVVGRGGLESDIQVRVLDLVGNARRHSEVLAAGPRAYLERYAAGLNAYLECCRDDFPFELGLLDLQPVPWTVEDLMSVMHYVGFVHSRNWQDELMTVRLAAALGADKAGELLPLNRNPERTAPYSELGFERLRVVGPGAPSAADGLRQPASLRPASLRLAAGGGSGPARFPAFGSNNWAVAPSRTASGHALLASDPHLDPRILPGPWIPMGLFAGGIRAFGLAVPAMPALLVGRNADVAWGVTNGYGDSQDLFFERVDGQDPNRYADGDGWKTFDTRTETIRVRDADAELGYVEEQLMVRSTVRGPVVTDHPGFEAGAEVDLSLRWTLAGPQRGEIGIDRFLTAGSVEELEAAVADIDVMFFNVAIADRHGAIARRSSGRVPTRAAGVGPYPVTPGGEPAWTGWIPKEEMPGSRGEDVGWIATANNDLRPDDYGYFYSSHFAPDYRYRRIAEMLEGEPRGTAEAHWALILDDLNLQARALAPRFADALDSDSDLADLAERLRGWDHRDDQESVAAAIYHVLYEQLFGLVFDDELGTDLGLDLHRMRYFWIQRFDQLLLHGESPWFDDVNTSSRQESLDDLIREAGRRARAKLSERLGPDPEGWAWGELHQIAFVSPLRVKGYGSELLGLAPIPLSGSGETVLRAQYKERDDFAASFVDSARFVADFSNDAFVLGVVAGGVVARQGHPAFKNQVSVWASGEFLRWWIQPERARAETSLALRLESR
ncbi:MAG: penicillin acylase family protein [Acidobacteriota bacterium]